MKRIKYSPSKEVRVMVLLLKTAAVLSVVYYTYLGISLGSMMLGATPTGAPDTMGFQLFPAIMSIIAGVVMAVLFWSLALLVSFAASIAHHVEESVVFQQHILEEQGEKESPQP